MFHAFSTLIVVRKFADSFSHLRSLQWDDMHWTKTFSESTGASTQCVLSMQNPLLKLVIIRCHPDILEHITFLTAYGLFFRLLLLQCPI